LSFLFFFTFLDVNGALKVRVVILFIAEGWMMIRETINAFHH